MGVSLVPTGGGYAERVREWLHLFLFASILSLHTTIFTDPVDKTRHHRMVTLVTRMLDLNKRLQDARLEQEKTQLSRQIEVTDASIDRLVYKLYGLTVEGIAIVEGTGNLK